MLSATSWRWSSSQNSCDVAAFIGIVNVRSRQNERLSQRASARVLRLEEAVSPTRLRGRTAVADRA
jgi:hypothetical protein